MAVARAGLETDRSLRFGATNPVEFKPCRNSFPKRGASGMASSLRVTCVEHAMYGGPAGRFGEVGFCGPPVLTTNIPTGVLSLTRMGTRTMLTAEGRL